MSDEAGLSVSLTRLTLNDIACGRSPLDDAIENGSIEVNGSVDMFKAYLDLHDSFDLWFDIVEP